jgi:uncharacterized protein YodC (DUF2158 family)
MTISVSSHATVRLSSPDMSPTNAGAAATEMNLLPKREGRIIWGYLSIRATHGSGKPPYPLLFASSEGLVVENSNFKVGDTVRLNSGGPLMTVEKIIKMTSGKDEVDATWFDGKKKLNDRFKSETLTHDSGLPGAIGVSGMS